MQSTGWALVLAGLGSFFFLQCAAGKKTSDGDEGGSSADGGGGSGGEQATSSTTAASSSSSSASSVASSSSSSSTGGGPCANVPVPGNNADPLCTSCMQASCCPELMSMDIPTMIPCAQMNCQDCFYQICDATYMSQPIGYFFFEDCSNCMGSACCQEFKDCLADASCSDCVLNANQTACNATTLDDTFLGCQSANCAAQCGA
jgi:hypothetical protein